MGKRLWAFVTAVGVCLSAVFWVKAMDLSELHPAQDVSATTVRLPILMYHHLLKDESKHNQYTISPQEFSDDLAYLTKEGYSFIVVEDLLAYVNDGVPLPEKPVMITFDDGHESFFVYALPLLEAYDAKAVLSVVGSYVDQASQHTDHNVAYSYCTWEQLYTLQATGRVEIQNHSYDLHSLEGSRKGAKPKLGESKENYAAVLCEDLSRLQQTAATFLQKSPNAFTYPFGFIHRDALPVLKSLGFQAAFSCEEKLNYITGEAEQLFHLRRINRPHGKSAQEILSQLR